MGADLPTIRIEGGPLGLATKVYIDDVEQRGVSYVSFSVSPLGLAEVSLTFLTGVSIKVIGEVDTRVEVEGVAKTPEGTRTIRGSGVTLREALGDAFDE